MNTETKRLKILLYGDSYSDRVGQSVEYVDFLNKFGEVILINAQNDWEFWLDKADVLAMPGGADVNPAKYGERPHYTSTRGNWQYEYLDDNLLPAWMETGKPIIGICRGLQALNVAMGGRLFQDINGHRGGENRTEPMHWLCTDIHGFNRVEVNSFHHQAIKVLGEGLEVIGWSPIFSGCPTLWGGNKQYLKLRHCYDKKSGKKDNNEYWSIPEIVRGKTLPYIAFQYHPEETSCALASKLIRETLEAYYPQAEIVPSSVPALKQLTNEKKTNYATY